MTFPAAFFVPKAIYRFNKNCTAKEVCEIINFASDKHSKGFLGKTVKIKPNLCAKHSYQVFFRAPYCKVDKDLLHKFGINSEEE